MLVCTVKDLAKSQTHRLTRAKHQLSVYLGETVSSLSASHYITRGANSEWTEQIKLTMSLVDAMQSKIAARQRPKPQITTKNASWKTRVQARKLNRFLEGVLHKTQGQFENTWVLTEQIFKDAEIWGTGVLKVFPDCEGEKIVHERAFFYELFVDPRDAKYGNPKNLFHRYGYSRAALIAAYPSQERAIRNAPAHKEDYATANEGLSAFDPDLITVYEGWYLPPNRKSKGVHVLAIDSEYGGPVALVEEDYCSQRFPFIFYRWQRAQFGIEGRSLVDQVEGPHCEALKALERTQEQVELLSGGYIIVDPDAFDISDIERNDTAKIIQRKPGATGPDPQIVMPPAFNSSTLDYGMAMKSLGWEVAGANELLAQGNRPAGVNSGVALRNLNDLQGERFLLHSRSYEQLFVEIARLDLEAACALAGSGVKPKVSFADEDCLREIDWDEIDLPEDCYEVTIQPASSHADSVAGRLELISEWQATGWIQPDVAARLQSQTELDTENFSRRRNAQHRWIERLISKVQDTDEDELEDLELDPPDPLMNLPAAMLQMAEAYVEMQAYEDTEQRCAILREWIVQARDELTASQEPETPPPGAQPPQGQEPQGMPPEGMPPQM